MTFGMQVEVNVWCTIGMQYAPIQRQGQKPLKVGNPAIFNSYFLRRLQWELATEHWYIN